jgi:AraC-like DNA-binding protein
MLNKTIYTNPQETIEKVRKLTDELIQIRLNSDQIENLPHLIVHELNTDYQSLDIFFLTTQEIGLDRFIFSRIIEKIKELLVYTDQSFKEIAKNLGYDNTRYLSNQLKKQTGFLPSHYKQIRRNKQKLITRK